MTQESFFSLFMGKNLIKILLLIICLTISIPSYYHLFDNGSQVLQLGKLASGKQSFSSRNVTVTGRLLSDKAILETEFKDGTENYRRYIIPLVTPGHKPNDPVYCFIEREFKEWDGEANEDDIVQALLAKGSDSVLTIRGVAMNFLYESLMKGLSAQSFDYFTEEQRLNVASGPLLIQVDHKLSTSGLIFMTLIQLFFAGWILISYLQIKKLFDQSPL